MFKNILVAIDGSESGRRAFETALSEAKAAEPKAALNAIYVVENGGLDDLPPDNDKETLYSKFESMGKEILSGYETAAESQNVKFTAVIRHGHAGKEITKYAGEINADLIVMGSTGKSNIEKLLLGSVTDFVIRHINISTLVVRL